MLASCLMMEQIQTEINPDMLAIAREHRQLNQSQLASAVGVQQGFISQLEGGVLKSCSADVLNKLSTELGFPVGFFSLRGERLGFGSSALFYRKNGRALKSLSLQETRHVSSRVNLHRLAIKRMMDIVDIDAQIRISKLPEGTTPEGAAAHVRALWSLPSGAINNLLSYIERSGIIVIECDFADAIAGTSIWYSDLPPIIFVDSNLKADRLRFTLAHELGHLLLHTVPSESMEDEADAFASALLLDKAEFFAMSSPWGNRPKLRDFLQARPYWKVSIQAMIERLYRSERISAEWRRSLYVMISSYGIRDDAIPFPKERPSLSSTMFSASFDTIEAAAQILRYPAPVVKELFVSSELGASSRPKLRAV
jgi:Zn-dependent peptidase ImmA (M78 family)/transcriptional regulator with XRE-family HTH domain